MASCRGALFETCGGPPIAGQGRMLGRRAPKLLLHVKEALQQAGLSSTLGTDYGSVLRSNLLATPSYCAATPPDTFQGVSGEALPL